MASLNAMALHGMNNVVVMILTNTQCCIQTERQADCCEFPAVVSNSLVKTINKIVVAFAFSDLKNGTDTLLSQLFVCVCLL